MKRIILAFVTYLFLVILAPVFAFSMVAPWAMEEILRWWSTFVIAATLLGAGVFLWIHWETRS